MTSARNVSRIRTALPQAWGALVVFLLDRLDIVADDSTTDLVLYLGIPLAGAVVYDFARLAERRGWDRVAKLLLGSLRSPQYPPQPGP